MTRPARIRVGGREAFDLDEVAPVYAAAFAAPPYSEPDASDLLRRLPRHADRSGFAIATARDEDEVVGFAYGVTASADSGWLADVADVSGPVFELVELAVDPRSQGRGIGTALLAAVLSGRAEPVVVLQTHDGDGDGAAMHLYERAGFRRLGPTTVGVAMTKRLR